MSEEIFAVLGVSLFVFYKAYKAASANVLRKLRRMGLERECMATFSA